MKNFFYKLIPPRPDFPYSITPDELAIMQEHSRYWDQVIVQGGAIALGPVADPSGTYGIGILQAESIAIAQQLVDEDPAIKSRRGFRSEVFPMLGLKKA